MTGTRKYALAGAALIAMTGAGGATALAADDGSAAGAPATAGATGHVTAGKPTMRSMEPAAMGRMMGGMGVKLDTAQLATMARAHDKMVGGMMSGAGMHEGG